MLQENAPLPIPTPSLYPLLKNNYDIVEKPTSLLLLSPSFKIILTVSKSLLLCVLQKIFAKELLTLTQTITPIFTPKEKLLIDYLIDTLSNEMNHTLSEDLSTAI